MAWSVVFRMPRAAGVLTLCLGLATLAWAGLPSKVAAQTAVARVGMIEERLAIPIELDGLFGKKVYNLSAYIARPANPAPAPFAILNHGKPPGAHEVAAMRADGMAFHAREFARRGFVAVAFLRRGFGISEGESAIRSDGCKGVNRHAEGLEAAKDVMAVLDWTKRLAYVDPARGVIVGQSHGGFATVATSSLNPPGVVAMINFAGGIGSRDRPCGEAGLIEAAERYGKTAKLPTLWVYTENDRLFGPVLSSAMHRAYSGMGGNAEYKLMPPFRDDGHYLFSMNGGETWIPLIDAFLRRVGLPTWDPDVEKDVAARMPNDAARASLARYLKVPGEKAFAYSTDGRTGWQWESERSTEEVKAKALASCNAKPGGTAPCSVALVNYELQAQ